MIRRASSTTLLEPQSFASERAEQADAGSHRSALMVVFAGAALVILFGWLHLIVALQIASTGRDIQAAAEELNRLERDNRAVVLDIAAAEAEQKMAARAAALGYGPQAPLYLSLTQPISAPITGTVQVGASEPGRMGPAGPVSEFLLPAEAGAGMAASRP